MKIQKEHDALDQEIALAAAASIARSSGLEVKEDTTQNEAEAPPGVDLVSPAEAAEPKDEPPEPPACEEETKTEETKKVLHNNHDPHHQSNQRPPLLNKHHHRNKHPHRHK